MPRLSKRKREQLQRRISEGEQLEDILCSLPKHFFYLVFYMDEELGECIANAYFNDIEALEFIQNCFISKNKCILAGNQIKNLVGGKVLHGFSDSYLNEEETGKVYQFLENNL